ncbi:MAG: hypothetical protein A3F18_01850 [Legionellales bacterium RIFCSPHIGHO2_12_FULL_37_14]|nr:MAG: hypothetical protein A3F18_01850 [Legionellales bacterium RIFCSPHIGHO2_12_FULL_37_14]
MPKLKLSVLALCIALNNQTFADEDAEITELLKFMISDQLMVSYDGVKIPLSYSVGTPKAIDLYFGDYICAKASTCEVVDHQYSNPYAVLGQGLPPENGTEQQLRQAQAQIERTDVMYGTDIYDAATWTIAIALAHKNGNKVITDPLALIKNYYMILEGKNKHGYNGFNYGYKTRFSENDFNKAFIFRMIAPNFENLDPFVSTDKSIPRKYSAGITCDASITTCKQISTWSDWKPILGENAWAQLIGPLQSAILLNDAAFTKETINKIIPALDGFSAMQAGIGAFYYAPEGSDGNEGPIVRGTISLENNFSLLGGLQILRDLLTQQKETDAAEALKKIDVMLNGGETVNKFRTVGLLYFLYKGAFNQEKGIFYSGGIAPDPTSTHDWQPDKSDASGSNAVDVNTWGIAALGPKTIDEWFGKDTAYNIWTNTRDKGGYTHDGTLWGVGYTLNNKDESEQILSAEWTAGAINTVYILKNFYPDHKKDLEDDENNMRNGIVNLRSDKYLAANFKGGTPKDYYAVEGLSYLYASKRFHIPFGWYANTLPSTASTSWVIMNHYNFNPFQYAGALDRKEAYPKPTQTENLSGGDPLPKDVAITFDAGNLEEINKLSLLYTTKDDDNFIPVSEVDKRKGVGTVPAGAKKLAISFYKEGGGYSRSCQLYAAKDICQDDNCTASYVLSAAWSQDGNGACLVSKPLPNEVQVRFTAGELRDISGLSLQYMLPDSETWQQATNGNIEGSRSGTATIPNGANELSLSFKTDNWYGACKVYSAGSLCANPDCTKILGVEAKYSSNGMIDCKLTDDPKE